jgi:hypothetical protein
MVVEFIVTTAEPLVETPVTNDAVPKVWFWALAVAVLLSVI